MSVEANEKSNLIVAPLALLQQWKDEIESKTSPKLFSILIHVRPFLLKPRPRSLVTNSLLIARPNQGQDRQGTPEVRCGPHHLRNAQHRMVSSFFFISCMRTFAHEYNRRDDEESAAKKAKKGLGDGEDYTVSPLHQLGDLAM